jgi:hypothetical protein
VQEAQDSFTHSSTLPRDQCRNSSLLMVCRFAPSTATWAETVMLTIVVGAAAGVEFRSIRFRTRDIANRYPA